MGKVEMAVVVSEEADEVKKFAAKGLDIAPHRAKMQAITTEVLANTLMALYEASKPEIFEMGWRSEKFAATRHLLQPHRRREDTKGARTHEPGAGCERHGGGERGG